MRLPVGLTLHAAVADHRDLARQDGGGHEFQADPAHLLAEAGHELVGDGERGLGRDVARGRAGAAGGEHQMAAGLIDQLDQGRLDHRLLVRNQARFSVRQAGLAMALPNQSSSAGMPSSLYTPAEARSLIGNQADQ